MRRKTYQSSLLIVALFLAASSFFTSCGDGKELSQGSAKKALKEMTKMKDSSLFVTLNFGYFEIPEEAERLIYRKLAKAGMINYKMDVIVAQERRGGWYGSYMEDVPHYFVAASLTEEGKKYIVYNTIEEEEDKDLIEKEDDTVYPEAGEYPSDKWYPAGTQPEPSTVNDDDDEFSDTSTSTVNNSTTPQTPYEQALKKVTTQELNLLSTFVKINKVRNILCDEVEGRARAEVICEYDKITPFGRIVSDLKKGQKFTFKADFIRYADKGWKIAD